jgi:alkanesulfonate monooxygenase SsuD/methylene tetrahydromethanopterin reductase-like flavin-dependent oxidoreductase (luciferase family)
VVVSATRRHGAVAVLARPPIRTPLLLAAQGPKGRAVAKVIADGLSWRWATPDRALILVSYRSTALYPARRRIARAVRAALAPLLGTIYHGTLARDPEAVRRLPNGQARLNSVIRCRSRSATWSSIAATTGTSRMATIR